jgi:hypothetical protein
VCEVSQSGPIAARYAPEMLVIVRPVWEDDVIGGVAGGMAMGLGSEHWLELTATAIRITATRLTVIPIATADIPARTAIRAAWPRLALPVLRLRR